jgi:hypothetical protein
MTTFDLYLGRRPSGAPGDLSTFPGQLDEIGLYNRALSLAEIQSIFNAGSGGKCLPPPPACTPTPSGLVSWWRSEGNAVDSADGNNGTPTGVVTFVPGKVGQSFDFDGNYSSVQLGSPTNLQLQTFTIEAWVKRHSSTQATLDPIHPDNGAFLHYGLGGYGFTPGNDCRLQLTQVGVSSVFSPTLRLTDTNSFHHVAVTRSGSNALHGSVYLFTRQKFLNSSPFLQPPGTPKPDFSRYNFGGTLGGPLIANRVFYFANYERWMADAPMVSTFSAADAQRLGISSDNIGTYPAQFRAHTVTGKVDVLATPNQRLSSRYFYYYDRESPNTFGGNQTRDTASRFDEEPQSVTTQLVSIFRSNIVNEARFLFASRGISNGVEVNPNNPNISISGVGSFNGNANGHRRTRERGLQFNENLSIVKGAHTFKMGVDILPVWFKERITNINGTFTFGGLAAVAGVRGAISATDQFILTESGAIDPRPVSATHIAIHTVDWPGIPGSAPSIKECTG